MLHRASKRIRLPLLFSLLTALCLAPHALAVNITNLFNTGVSASGVKVTSSIPDLHYTSVSGGTVYVTGAPYVAWNSVSASTLSNWVTLDTANGYGSYTRTYRTSFTLPSNALPSSVVISGKVAVDNYLLNIYVNGNPIGFSLPGYTSANFTSFHNFTLPPNFFCTGTNNIDFVWKNADGPGAINVQYTTATYALQTPVTANIGNLYNTGVNAAGTTQVIPANTTTNDLHYSDLSTAGVFVVKNPTAGWLPVSSSLVSNWISLNGDDGFANPFVKTYRTAFSLPSSAIPGSVTIAGRAVVDNRLNAVNVNGTLQSFTIPTATSASFTAWHNFTLTGPYVAGANNIDFVWQNDASVSALRVEFTQKTYQYYRRIPCILSVDTGSSNILLRWMAPEAIRSRVKRSTAPGGPYTLLTETTDSSFVDANVSVGKTYYYVVSAVADDGTESDNSGEVPSTPLPVVAWWRFEEGTTGTPVAPAPFQLADNSGNGNTLQVEDGFDAPYFTEDVSSSALNSGQENILALALGRDHGSSLPTGLSTIGATGDINSHDFTKCTIEASFLLEKLGQTYTLLSRNVDGAPDPVFAVQVTDGSTGTPPVVSVQALQADGTYLTLDGITPIQAGQWYNVAVVSDGSRLSLYLQTTPGGAYNLENARPHKPIVWIKGSWKVENHGDPHEYVDEMRLCDAALKPSQFLFRSNGRPVNGTVALDSVDDLSAISPAAPLGTFDVTFRVPGTTTAVYGGAVTLSPQGTDNPNGTFTVVDVPAGAYDVTIKGSKNLQVLIPGFVVDGTTALPPVLLPGGDANNDNGVDISDFATLVNNYNGHAGDTGYDDSADFNFDGTTDITDFSIFINNYGSTGAP